MSELAKWFRKLWPEKCPKCGTKNPFRLKYGSDKLIRSKTKEIPNYMAGGPRRTGFATQTKEVWQGILACRACGFEKIKTWRRISNN